MKNIFTAVLVMAVFSTVSAEARQTQQQKQQQVQSTQAIGALRVGSYEGKHNRKDKVHLFLKSVPGRSGSYFALLVKPANKMSLYLVDPLNTQSYAMIPLTVTDDGHIGIQNDDPSLTLTVAVDDKGKPIYRVLSANSGNNVGFTGTLDFNGKRSSDEWLDIVPGTYSQGRVKDAAQVSNFDATERETTVVMALKDLSGTFRLTERAPGMYLINQNSVFASGIQTQRLPKAIVIFYERRGGVEMILVDPANDSNLRVFER